MIGERKWNKINSKEEKINKKSDDHVAHW